jgi:hypothetical protein
VQKLSPVAFKDAFFVSLEFSMIDHFVYKTLFEFCPANAIDNLTDLNKQPLNSTIQHVTITGYNIKLDTNVLHLVVFEALQSLTIFGSIGSIDVDFPFSSFKQLFNILIASELLRDFFHRVGMDWSQNLNINNNFSCQTYDSSLITTYITELVFSNSTIYTNSNQQLIANYQFPDTDFCIFTKFPVDRIVLLSINYDIQNCSCLFFWLVHNYPYFIQYSQQIGHYEIAKQLNSTFLNCTVKGEGFIHQCLNKTEKSKTLCNLNRTQVLQTFYNQQDLEGFKLTLSFETAQYFISVALVPIFCIFGFFFNGLIIYVVRAQTKELKETFFHYMKLNSWFNCVYCAVYLTNLMSECIFPMGIYCSSIRTSRFVQYWKILVIEYFAGAMKICANVTYILMNVNRYMLIGRDHNRALQFISELTPKTVNIFLLLFSGLLSIVKPFQYQINYYLDSFDYPIVIDPVQSGYFSLAKAVNTIFSFFLDFTNSFLFCILSLIIEVVIVNKLKKELKEKEERMAGMSSGHTLQQNTTLSARSRHRKKQNESIKVEQKAILMTFINSFLNFTLRLPEIFIPVYLISETFYSKSSWFLYMCAYLSICEILIDMIGLFFIISSSVNYFIFYYFNKKFKEAVYLTLPVWVSKHLTLPRDSAIKPAINTKPGNSTLKR